MRVLLSFLVLSFIVSCDKAPQVGPGDDTRLASAAESDCGYVQNLYGERVSWKENIPVTLKVSASFPQEYMTVLKDAVQHWNDAAGITLLRTVENPTDISTTATKNSVNTVHWVTEWSDSQKKIQALTDLYWRGNQLGEADIRIDAKYFKFYIDQATTPYDIHLESLLIHELGHVLGLKHRSTLPSVMWAVLNGASVRQTLSNADKESLKCEY
jgi:predicted Zn-dependent protease